MPLHPAFRRLIDTKLQAGAKPQWELPIGDVRHAFRALWTPAMTGPASPVGRVENMTVPARDARIPARLYAPDRRREYPLLVYFHGGGYVKGGLDECDTFCRNLAALAQHVVLSVDYRLAPEHPFPAALDDAIEATAWACANSVSLGGSNGPAVVCGESAGGNLAALTALAARTDPRISLRYQVLLQPVLDFALSSASIGMKSDECLVPRDDLAWYYATYAGRDHDPRDPRVSPLYTADLRGSPPALIIAAEYDTLRDEAQAYASRLEQAGVPVRYSCYPGMIHGFLQMGGLVPDARAAVMEIASTLHGKG
jgi:acetyl esterase